MFKPSETILERIAFAMQDQSKSYLVDLDSGDLVSRPQEGTLPENLAAPPPWTPDDGFRIMESFCSYVKNIEAKRALYRALSQGKGVFRSFKRALSEYPREEAQFKAYKNSIMRRAIQEWIDDMRESLGLARLGPEPDDIGELLDSEFAIEEAPISGIIGELTDFSAEACGEQDLGVPVPAASLEKSEIAEFLQANAANGQARWIRDEEGNMIAAAAGAALIAEGRTVGVIRFAYAMADYREFRLETRLLDSLKDWFRTNGIECVLARSLFLRPDILGQLDEEGLETLPFCYLVR